MNTRVPHLCSTEIQTLPVEAIRGLTTTWVIRLEFIKKRFSRNDVPHNSTAHSEASWTRLHRIVWSRKSSYIYWCCSSQSIARNLHHHTIVVNCATWSSFRSVWSEWCSNVIIMWSYNHFIQRSSITTSRSSTTQQHHTAALQQHYAAAAFMFQNVFSLDHVSARFVDQIKRHQRQSRICHGLSGPWNLEPMWLNEWWWIDEEPRTTNY